MNSDAMARLLSGILDQQIESGVHSVISEDRLREAITSGPDFTDEEQRLFLVSSMAREDRRRAKRAVLDETLEKLKLQRVEMELLPLAASTVDDTVVLKGSGFSVTLYRRDEIGVPWIILVQLDRDFRQAINPLTVLRLVDSGGLEWLRGRADNNGELTGAWNDPETDLLERVRRFSLTLELA